jgi:hypothetical protein
MIPPPIELTPNTVADWVEASLLADEVQNRIADAAVVDALDELHIDEPEIHLANLRTEILRREHFLGARYPIRRRGLGYDRVVEWEDCLPYSFLLLVSLNQLYVQLTFGGGTAHVPAELFENITGNALRQYLGGEIIRLGAPRRQPVPAGFPAAVQYLADQLFEAFGYGQLEVQEGGDDGVDIIGWKPFDDGFSSQLVVLAQCAIGTDWYDKRSALDLRVWGRHIRCASLPVTAFAVPFQHELGGIREETALRGGILLDRARIVKNLSNPMLAAGDMQRLQQWCHQRMQAVRDMAAI